MCSHGGHLSELLHLENAWKDCDVVWITYDAPRTKTLEHAYRLRNIGKNPFWMAIAGLRIAVILVRERPAAVVSTGAEIAIPAFYLARLFGMRTVFVEVWTRVHRPTGTGRIVYPVTDHFFVQWPEMLSSYGRRARFVGALL